MNSEHHSLLNLEDISDLLQKLEQVMDLRNFDIAESAESHGIALYKYKDKTLLSSEGLDAIIDDWGRQRTSKVKTLLKENRSLSQELTSVAEENPHSTLSLNVIPIDRGDTRNISIVGDERSKTNKRVLNKTCKICGSKKIQRSRRQSLPDYLASALVMSPYRCCSCQARFLAVAL